MSKTAYLDDLLPDAIDGLYVTDDRGNVSLIGGACQQCGRHFFPKPETPCPDCQVPIDTVDMGNEGTIYAHTTVRTKPPFGLPRPYSVAYIDLLSAPIRIFALLDPDVAGEFSIGDRVRLAVGQLGLDTNGSPCLRPYFQQLSQ